MQVLMLVSVLLVALAVPAKSRSARLFHMDAETGDDGRDGLSPATAWKTIARANREKLGPGDSLLFRGGQVFPGTVVIKAPSGGAKGAPLTVSSFGSGTATIDGGAGDGLVAEGVSDLRIRNLAFRGVGRKEGNKGGRGVVLSRVARAEIDSVEASGFQKAGVQVLDSTNVRVLRVFAHDNGFAGIHFWGGKSLYAADCRAINNPGDPTIMNNHSGNGILLGGCKDGVVEYCEAAENGWDQPVGGQYNGPVGIWCHDAARVTIRHCIAHHNKSTSGDGGGFDFDGGTSDSLIEYCLSYDNKSSAVLLWEYGSELKLTRNIVRYNVSLDDGESGIRFGKSGGHDVTRIEIYNNLIVSSGVPCVWGQSGGVSDIVVRDNVFIHTGAGKVTNDKGGVTYRGNWSPSAKDAAALSFPRITDPRKLDRLRAFVLPPLDGSAGKGILP